MKTLRLLFVALFVIGFVGLNQAYAQANVVRGEEYKHLLFEIDGMNYRAVAHVEFQYEVTPSDKFNWAAHGYLVYVEMEDENGFWNVVTLEDLKIKRTIRADDPNPVIADRETVRINPTGRVKVIAHW